MTTGYNDGAKDRMMYPHMFEAAPERQCTCHPDDNPPVPCPRKFALTDCRLAASERRIEELEGGLNAAVRAAMTGDRHER